MPIVYHAESKVFHLYNQYMSYMMGIMENGQLENLYFGKKLLDHIPFQSSQKTKLRPVTDISVPVAEHPPLQHIKQEYPSYGTGDFRSPAVEIRLENGSTVSDFRYDSHRIYKGKKDILPLPATYVEEETEAESLEIYLYDEVSETRLTLSYSIYEAFPVITRHARFDQLGSQTISLERALSASVEFPDMDFEMVHLAGAWGRERYIKQRKLEMGLQSIQSLCGASSSEHNPFIALKRPNTDEHTGEAYGFSLVYSGCFLAQVEVSTSSLTRVTMGIHPQNFQWALTQGESFQTPETVIVYSDHGLNSMSQAYHKLFRSRLARGIWRDQPRPILLNNWEATYFNFNEEKLLRLANKAREAGIELFVLDDGWFGARNDDHRGLGDWFVNTAKLPDGIGGLSQKIEAMGMKFGLWVELEMINKDSDLYRAHPDWLLTTPQRFETPSRNQHVLDFTRSDIVDAIYEMIANVIAGASISYIKWDMNRYITEAYSSRLPANRQGEVMHRYILGVYNLYTRLIQRFPYILFESCASGGARFDPGMLFFAPQAWTSDNTDAMERVKIQYGTSMVYPLSSMGSHVSIVPNHQVGRVTPISTRANAAFFGTYGYEMDLNQLNAEDFEAVKANTAFMKQYRQLIQIDGTFYRLESPFEGNNGAWMVVSPDKKTALAAYFQYLNSVNFAKQHLKLTGLSNDALYKVCWGQHQYQAYGDELMQAGILIEHQLLREAGGDFASLLFEIKAE